MKKNLFCRWLSFLLVIGLVFCSANADDLILAEEEMYYVEESLFEEGYENSDEEDNQNVNEQPHEIIENGDLSNDEINYNDSNEEDSSEIVYEDYEDNGETASENLGEVTFGQNEGTDEGTDEESSLPENLSFRDEIATIYDSTSEESYAVFNDTVTDNETVIDEVSLFSDDVVSIEEKAIFEEQETDLEGGVIDKDKDTTVIEQEIKGTEISAYAEKQLSEGAVTIDPNFAVDMVFIVDTTESMQPYISSVIDNISKLGDSLLKRNIKVNFCLIEYRDITVDGLSSTIIHRSSLGYWNNNLTTFKGLLNNLTTGGGGDYPETPTSALKMICERSFDWNNIQKFVFVLTDDTYKDSHNDSRIPNMNNCIQLLNEKGIHTSIVGKTAYQNDFYNLYSLTGGKYINIDSVDYYDVMVGISDLVSDKVDDSDKFNIEAQTAHSIGTEFEIVAKWSGDTLPKGIKVVSSSTSLSILDSYIQTNNKYVGGVLQTSYAYVIKAIGNEIGLYNLSLSADGVSPKNIDIKIVEGIVLYASSKKLAIRKGDTIDFLATIRTQNGYEPLLLSPNFTIENESVISLSNYKKTSNGHEFSIKGTEIGSSKLIISDSNIGTNASIVISVFDEPISKDYNLTIDDVPLFYPNVFGDKHQLTNIYDFHGLYVKDYDTKRENDGTRVSMNIYNTTYMLGAVDVYDSEGNWIESYQINKYKNISSLYDTVVDGFYHFWEDVGKGDILSYTSHTISKCTALSFVVPEGGCFVISNNFASPGVYFYNCLDIVFCGIEAAFNALEEPVKDVSVAGEVLRKLKKPSDSKKLIDLFANSAKSKFFSMGKNATITDIAAATKLVTTDFGDILKLVGLDLNTIIKDISGISEKALVSKFGFIGAVLEGMFTVNKSISLISQTSCIANSGNRNIITIHNVPGSKITKNSNDVIVTYMVDVLDNDAEVKAFYLGNKDTYYYDGKTIDPGKYKLYNISISKNGETVQPKGNVTVKIPVPDNMYGDECVVFRQETDGTWTQMNVRFEDGFITFETDHFSLYLVTEDRYIKSSVASSIKLDKTSATTYVGMTTKITATVTGPSKTVTWSSSDKSIATVKNGVVTGVKAGTATITAKANGKTAKCKVTVKKPEILLSPTSLTLYTGDTYYLIADVFGKSSKVVWKSKNSKIASVDGTGIVKAKKAGSAVIVATANGVSATCTVKVKDRSGISNSRITIGVGDKWTLSLYGTTIKSVSTDDQKVATVSKKGVVKGIKAGKAKIVLKGKNGKSYKCIVTVVKKAGISDNKITLKPGEQKKLDLYVTTIVGTSTDDVNVAVVDSDGTVTALNTGKAKIVLTGSNGKSYKCIVTVEQKTGINYTRLTLKVGDTEKLVLYGTNIQGVSTDDVEVALIGKDGTVSAVGAGKAKIVLTGKNSKKYKCIVTVEEKSGISDKKLSLSVNQIKVLSLYGTSIRGVSTDDVRVATVSKDGVVTAQGKGKAKIVLTGMDGKSYKCIVTVS